MITIATNFWLDDSVVDSFRVITVVIWQIFGYLKDPCGGCARVKVTHQQTNLSMKRYRFRGGYYPFTCAEASSRT